MAKLLKKKHLINSSGEEELLDIYTTKVEATQSRLPCKSVLIDIDGQMTTCYIGLTDELDTLKCSSKRVQIDDKTYAERKYMGMVNFNNYMKNTYPDTYKTMTEVPEELPDTSDSVNFYSAFSDCGINSYDLKLNNANNLSFTFENCKATSIKIDAFRVENMQRTFRDCHSLNIIFGNINTKYCYNYYETFRQSPLLTSVNFNIDLSSISQVTDNTFYAMFLGCEKLKQANIVNAPISLTKENFNRLANVPTSCNINFSYRTIKEHSPIKIIKAQNMKLIEIGNDDSYSIIRDGNKPLDEYIIHQSEYGTLYSDGKGFGCFVTKDDIIYAGESYTNETRDPSYQPEIPDGITIPRCFIAINKNISTKTHSYIIKNLSYHQVSFMPIIHLNNNMTWNSYNNYEFFSKNNSIFSNMDYLISAYTCDMINENKKYSQSISNREASNDILYIAGGIYSDKTTFQQFNLYEGQLYYEELEKELRNIDQRDISRYYEDSIVKIVQAQNGKLVEWDKNKNMRIIRNGFLPLEDYIVYEDEYGTIYSDGSVTVENLAPNTIEQYNTALHELANIQQNNELSKIRNIENYREFDFHSQIDHQKLIRDINDSNLKNMPNSEKIQLKTKTIPTPINFGCYVTKENEIYVGSSYNSANRDIKYQPYVADNIQIPNCLIKIEKGNFNNFQDFSGTVYGGIMLNQYIRIFTVDNGNTTNCAWTQFKTVQEENKGTFYDAYVFKVEGKLYHHKDKSWNDSTNSGIQDYAFNHINLGTYKDLATTQLFKRICFYDTQITLESLQTEVLKDIVVI